MRSRTSSNASMHSASSTPEETMNIFVKLIDGETIALSLPASTSISTILQLLSLRTSLPTSQLRLAHAGRHLATTSSSAPTTLESLSLQANSTLTLSKPLRGGAPKKIRCGAKDCKEQAQRIVGDCGFCNGHFCGKHRMLEDHKCSGLEDCKKESKEQNRVKLESERTMVVRGI